MSSIPQLYIGTNGWSYPGWRDGFYKGIPQRRWLIILGIVLLVAGIAWPWLEKLGLGRLPGDFVIERENFRLYFPFGTSLLVSLVLSLIFWLIRR
ncbi:MAG: DUF2905 family protein [Rhodospirillales bacterium]|nr:DUF2905 family protein [Rhodospirillales bacterium]